MNSGFCIMSLNCGFWFIIVRSWGCMFMICQHHHHHPFNQRTPPTKQSGLATATTAASTHSRCTLTHESTTKHICWSCYHHPPPLVPGRYNHAWENVVSPFPAEQIPVLFHTSSTPIHCPQLPQITKKITNPPTPVKS
jgi:hypothetical protein